MRKLGNIIGLFFALFLCVNNIFSQNIDSLKLALKHAKHDTTRCIVLNNLAEYADEEEWPGFNEQLLKLAKKCALSTENINLKKFYLKHEANALGNVGYFEKENGNMKSALDYYYKSLKLHQQIQNNDGISAALFNIGDLYNSTSDEKRAIDFFNKSLRIQESLNNKIGMNRSLNNLGTIYNKMGELQLALSYYYKSLQIQEEMNDKSGMATTFNNLGTIYESQNDNVKTLEYYNKSLKIQEELKDYDAISVILTNIGSFYYKNKDVSKAMDFFTRSLKISQEINNGDEIAANLINIGLIYRDKKDYAKALDFINKGLILQEKIQDKSGISQSLSLIAKIYLEKEQLSNAIIYAEKSLSIAQEIGFPKNIIRAGAILKLIYFKQKKYEKAFKMYELEIQMHDSLNNESNRKASVKKQFQYEYEKKAAADSVKNGEEQKVKNALLTAQEAELKQEKTKSYALYGGLILVLMFAGFMVNRFRVTHKQKQIIELKEIETQKQNEIITHQKQLVEEKHKEITDSINYAERIQRSFLATKELLDHNLRDYFIFFQPKDVVSGDFYWANKLSNGNFLLAIADSTGHGVPGAIMSILNISCLEKSVEEQKLVEPNEILNHTRLKIIERLKKDGSAEGGKDGMDCSLISFDFKNSKLSYAAANNPIWIVRDKKLIELSSDKMPVGKHDRDLISFTQHTIDLHKGDIIYAFTDGMPDQFGGPNGKKFKYKQLKELLISVNDLEMEEQKEALETALNTWKGNLEQVDDVCLIGVRV